MCEIIELVPYIEKHEAEIFLRELTKKYDDKVKEEKGNFIKLVETKFENDIMVEIFTYYKKTLFGKREIALYKFYHNRTTDRVSTTNLKFV